MTRALVPGTFDPITKGHVDVVARTSKLFDEVVVGVACSTKKAPLFSLDERVELAQEALKDFTNVTILPFDNLLVDFAREQHTHVIVKGLRAITDFEYEFQMTAVNYRLDPELETLFIMSGPEFMYLSSSMVREIASLHGNIEPFVTDGVRRALEQKFA